MPDEQQQPNQPPPAPNPERKTLDDRNKMSDLERLRHSCAHVFATAVLRLWPEAQLAYGPPVETGFYYDLEMPHRDHRKIGQEMGLFAIDTECATSRARSRSSQTWGFATAVLNRHHGQTNREAGAVARLTRDFDGAAVRFHNRFGDGEAEAGAAGGAGA